MAARFSTENETTSLDFRNVLAQVLELMCPAAHITVFHIVILVIHSAIIFLKHLLDKNLLKKRV
jgi:hypothetical protein